MRVHLRPCAQCGRHIRITENLCVFCGAPVDPARQSAPPLGDAASRLRRAATLVAIGTVAGTGIGLDACGGNVRGGTVASTEPGASNNGASSSGPLLGGVMYGVIGFSPDTAPDAPPVFMADAAYGVLQFVPELDAAADAGPGAPDAAGDGDAGPEVDVFTAADAYGVPPFPVDGSSEDASGDEKGDQIDP